MATIDAMVLDGTVTTIAIAILGLELLALLYFARPRLSIGPIVANAFSGLFLILALRAALVGSGAMAIGIWLGLGFLAHLTDLLLRLRR